MMISRLAGWRSMVILAAGLAGAGAAGGGRPDDSTGPSGEPAAGGGGPGLAGTRWRLEDLAGAGVLDDVEATLEFGEDDWVGGNGSCNRFFGTAMVAGSGIEVGPLGATRMGCAEAIMNQETGYLRALETAERFQVRGPFLYLYAAGRRAPLRFIRM